MKNTDKILHKFNKETIIFALFFILIVIGIFLRLYGFTDFTTFLGDQGRDAIIMRNIMTGTEFPLLGPPSSIGMVFLGPFYYYLLSPFLLLFAFNPIGVAYGIFFLTIIGLITQFYIVKKIVNSYTAIIFTCLVVFAYPLVDISRFAWNPNLVPLFSFFVLVAGYRFIKNDKEVDAIILGIIFALATQLHHLTFLLAVPIVLCILYHFLTSQDKVTIISNIFIAVIAFMAGNAPFLWYELNHNFTNIEKLTRFFTETNGHNSASFFSKLLETNHAFFEHIIKIGWNPYAAIIIFTLMIGLSIWAIIKYKPSIFIILNFINIVTFLLLFSVVNTLRHAHYYASLYISFFLILAYLFSVIPLRIIKYTVTSIFLIAFIATTIPRYYFLYEKNPSKQIETTQKVAKSIQDHNPQGAFQIAILPGHISPDPYSYFLEKNGSNILLYDSYEQPNEFYVICLGPGCIPTNEPFWTENKKLMESWKVEDIDQEVTIHRIIHKK